MALRLDLAIHKARIASREAGNIRGRGNRALQKAAVRAEFMAVSTLRKSLLLKELSVSDWDKQIAVSQGEYEGLKEDRRKLGNRKNRMLRFDSVLAAHKVWIMKERRRKAEVVEVEELSYALRSWDLDQ